MIKIKILLFIFGSISMLKQCDRQSYQAECVNLNSSGYIELKLSDNQKGQRYKAEQARKDALKVVLFSGVQSENGCLSQPPLLESSEEAKHFSLMAKNFFGKNGPWSRFTIYRDAQKESLNIATDLKSKFYSIRVSKNLLRQYLIEQNVLSPLTENF